MPSEATFIPKISTRWCSFVDIRICTWKRAVKCSIFCGVLADIIYRCWQWGFCCCGRAVWCRSCWWGRICGSAADRAHKEPFHQILKGHVYDTTSNLSPWNFTCNDQMIADCACGFFPLETPVKTHIITAQSMEVTYIWTWSCGLSVYIYDVFHDTIWFA